MITVVDTNSSVRAIIKVGLISSAAHIIQEDRSSSRSKDTIIVHLIECYGVCRWHNKIEVAVNKVIHFLMSCIG